MENKEFARLTERQKSLVVATLLTDGWLEVAKDGKSALVGLELSQVTLDLIKRFQADLAPFASPHIYLFERPPVKPGGKVPQMARIRTFYHEQFLQFIEPFAGLKPVDAYGILYYKVKTVPRMSYLLPYLNYEMFAYMLMMDGSRKNHGQGMELHLQSFSYKAQARLCIALYEKLGIKCWPSNYRESDEAKTKKFHITISGFSADLIRAEVKPFFVESLKYKIPSPPRKRMTTSVQSPWAAFYEQNKDADWLETLD